MDAKLKSRIRDAAPTSETPMDCGRRLGAQVAAGAKRTITQGVCRLVCAYLEKAPNAQLVVVDGVCYDAAIDPPAKVADVVTALS